MPCNLCGSITGVNDLFCQKCGSKTMKEPRQYSELIEGGQEVISTCKRCNAGVTKDQMYCTVCGNAIMAGPSVDLGDE